MVRKVRFFETDDISRLQDNVNEFLDTLPQYNVVDVRYNHYRDPDLGDRAIWYTAMVLYSDNKDTDSDGYRSVPQGIEMKKSILSGMGPVF